jgi:hypothetical protein
VEFLFVSLILFAVFGIGLTSHKYDARARLMLISASIIAPMMFFMIWQVAS